MNNLIAQFEQKQRKTTIPDVRPGETVKVHYRIRESNKERIQIFEGLVIGTKGTKSLQGSFTVRKVVDGIGVERTFPLHSPWVTKVERVKSGKVRRAKLNFVRQYALSRKFKLRDKGVEGTIWEDVVKEQKEVIAEDERQAEGLEKPVEVTKSTEEVAESEQTVENGSDDQAVEPTGDESGADSSEVSPTEETPDPKN